ncbi:PhoH family protein [Synechococcus sp. CS-602]|uniref:PhoH family protein n=1 Tax=Synechococcaceae TaxID=1890426 RepID=UPI0008FF3D07|nr:MULTISPECIES: PhoH family protein [Synechococcaceae]MCT4364110.1 PhoH family protein [Candidatus Regnicoccus frigidus MAG-AL1]APD48788.1 phosphate starvation-inducible protein PhoH [Synechococcus sp. SynAce01]MCT0203911.1 PhoH family protein [Synechococcus sp. CS-602]MCT0245499.1 PhoH family protein [Synechococcus sp. CS-601]MCT4367281.1 PhoH family protein [Candidatus Regnicoccus frigidus MAG-AL2]
MAGAERVHSFVIDLPDQASALALAGEAEATLHRLEALTGASLVLRGLQLVIQGQAEQLERASALVELIRPLWLEGQSVGQMDLQTALAALDSGSGEEHRALGKRVLARSLSGKLLRPRTLGQRAYVEAIEQHDLTLALGPAGSGKTLLATVQAVRMLNERRVERLILTRPAVEAGERLGFLPGDLQQKVDPYLRPLYDALHSLLGADRTTGMLERGVIEVAPLAYMRGRTLADAFVIVDEAQNTTAAQMRMVLTRLGENSRMVVTGDPSQVDLPAHQVSGLSEAARVLDGVEGVAICTLTVADVVRHPLVQRVVQAYARLDAERHGEEPRQPPREGPR